MPTPKLGFSYISAGQAQKEITHNDALNDLDTLLMLRVLDRDLGTPPGAPATGDAYLVAASPPPGPTGAWAGQAGNLAYYYSGWKFKTPAAGWHAWIVDEGAAFDYNGTAWVAAGGTGGGGLAGLGTATAPGLSFTADSNTGFYSDGSDSLRAVANGVEGWRLSPTGALSVGTTAAPANNAKTVLNGGSNNAPYAQIGNSYRSLFFGSTYDAGSVGGTGYIGFNAARSAANAWVTGADGTQNGAALIDCAIAGGIRVFARNSTGGTAGSETDSTILNYVRMIVGETSISLGGDIGSDSLRVKRVTNQVNRLEATGAVGGSGAQLSAAGSDSNIDLRLAPKGTGRLRLDTDASNAVTAVGAAGAATALPANPVGYLRVNLNGTIRKIPYYTD